MREKKEMFWQRMVHEFEHFTDHIIPILVIALAIMLILENPFWTLVHLHDYEPWITIFDGLIVFFFAVDLVFKWFNTRDLRKFFKLYWLDIIAIFPFYLAFRAYAEVAAVFRVGEEISEAGQKVAHEAVLLREARLLREAEALGREAKEVRNAGRLLRAFRGRFYVSRQVLLEIHQRHKREHRATSQ